MIISEKKTIKNQELKNNVKNIPRIFAGDDISSGMKIPAPVDVAHYLSRVMRTDECLIFGGGREFSARLSRDGKWLEIGDQTSHVDPAGNITLYFSPIKRMDDLINMATQMGVGAFQPVIMAHTTTHHINWNRMHKIATESAEQSGRNSVPNILPVVNFNDLDLSDITFADERTAHGRETNAAAHGITKIIIGPEGGFSAAEFAALDAAGARGISLGKTILRAELAAAIAISRITE